MKICIAIKNILYLTSISEGMFSKIGTMQHNFIILFLHNENVDQLFYRQLIFLNFYICREAGVRELVQVLLRLITGELALEKITLGS